MAYQDDWRDRDPRWRAQRDLPAQNPSEGSEYGRPPTGGVVPGGAGSGPFSGYDPAGYAPASYTGFHGGEYLTGGMPGQFAGTFPAGGEFLSAGGMVISGLDSRGTLPTPREGAYHPGWRQAGRFAGRGPRNYRRSDERIAEDVNERLAWHSQINAEDVEVSVENCEVTLSGSVDSRFAKRLAEDIAESCAGVVDVHNRLRVDRSAGYPQGADREISRDIARDHEAAAERDPIVPKKAGARTRRR